MTAGRWHSSATALVINLARASDRKASIVAQLDRTGMPYEIVTAVDGRELNSNDQRLVLPEGLIDRKGNWPNVAGCALSHLACYRRILDAGWAGGLIIEDDATLPDDLMELTSQVAATCQGAEVVLYGYGRKRDDRPLLLSSSGSIEVGDRALVMPVDISQVMRALTYYITAEACRRMVDRLLPITVPADEWDFFYSHNLIDNLRCVWPQAVIIKSSFPSTIGYSAGLKEQVRLRLEKTAGFRRLLARRRLQVDEYWSEARLVDSASPLAGSRKGVTSGDSA